jgi:hypothetical protein
MSVTIRRLPGRYFFEIEDAEDTAQADGISSQIVAIVLGWAEPVGIWGEP